jgi:hypothetical protein
MANRSAQNANRSRQSPGVNSGDWKFGVREPDCQFGFRRPLPGGLQSPRPQRPADCGPLCRSSRSLRIPGMRGWGGRIRTSVWRNQNPLPYRLATPQSAAGPEEPAESGRTIVRALKRCNGLDCDFATSPKGRAAALSELGGNKTVIWVVVAIGRRRPRSSSAGRKAGVLLKPCRPLPWIATSLRSSRRRQPGPRRIRTKKSDRRHPALRHGNTRRDRRRLRVSPRGNR